MGPVQVVQAQVDAFNARDLERFRNSYNPDALIEDRLGTSWRGDATRYGQPSGTPACSCWPRMRRVSTHKEINAERFPITWSSCGLMKGIGEFDIGLILAGGSAARSAISRTRDLCC
jgi:hypothetical protein